MNIQNTSLRLCAVAIAVLSLLVPALAAEPPDFTPLVGKWQVTYPKNGVRAYEITNAKSILSDDGKAKMHAALTLAPDGCYEFTFQNKNFYRLRLSGDAMLIDHYLEKELFKKGLPPTQVGHGVKLSK